MIRQRACNTLKRTHLITSPNLCSFRYKRYYLGLDISSSKTGYSVLDNDGVAIECGLFDTQHIHDVQEFGVFMKENFREMAQRHKSEEDDEWVVGAEEFLLKFNDKST